MMGWETNRSELSILSTLTGNTTKEAKAITENDQGVKESNYNNKQVVRV